jgi:hypothetical protein
LYDSHCRFAVVPVQLYGSYCRFAVVPVHLYDGHCRFAILRSNLHLTDTTIWSKSLTLVRIQVSDSTSYPKKNPRLFKTRDFNKKQEIII